MLTSITIVTVAVAIYVVYLISQVRGTRALPIKTIRKRWLFPGTAVRVSGGAVEVEGMLSLRKIDLSTVRGVWWASKGAIQAIDNQLLGAVLFDEGGRGFRIAGWHVREGLGQAEGAMVLERTDALLEELSRANFDWRPKRVKGFLVYRLLLAATTAALVVVTPVALVWFWNLQGWAKDAGVVVVPAVLVAWIPCWHMAWRAFVRYQLRHNKEAFWRPGAPSDGSALEAGSAGGPLDAEK